jgi:hypothetical protein
MVVPLHINVNRKDISYEPGAVDYGGVYHGTGKIYIGPSAFEKSFDFLGAIIGHERVHYYQYKQVLIPPVNTMWDAATEVVAEDWVLRNIEKGRFSLNIDEKQIFEKGRDKNFKKLNEGYIKMYNEGFFNPKMPNWE